MLLSLKYYYTVLFDSNSKIFHNKNGSNRPVKQLKYKFDGECGIICLKSFFVSNITYSCIPTCDIFFFFLPFSSNFYSLFLFCSWFLSCSLPFPSLLMTFKLTKDKFLLLFFYLIETKILKCKKQTLE